MTLPGIPVFSGCEHSARPQVADAHAVTGDVWLSTDETARRLGMTTRTIYGFINRGELVAYRFGRAIRVTLCDLEAFIEACRIRP